MNRGDICWYTFRAPDKRRPVLILTRPAALSFLTKVTVAPLTTTIRGIRSEVRLEAGDGLTEASVVSLDNVTTVHARELTGMVRQLKRDEMRSVENALAFALGFHRRLSR